MIPEYQLYHGAVLASIIDGMRQPVTFQVLGEGRLLNYVVNSSVGLQIKHATQKLRPWHFSFPAEHIQTLQDLGRDYPAAFLVLVCRTDGLIAVPAAEILELIPSGTQGWIRANRRKREMYRLYGPLGEFSAKVRTTVEPIIEALRSATAAST